MFGPDICGPSNQRRMWSSTTLLRTKTC
jgi:hypothetical protein